MKLYKLVKYLNSESEQVESSPEETDTDVPKEEKIKIIEKEVLETIDKTTSNISNSEIDFTLH